MKTLSLIVLCLGLSLATLAQAPKAFKYQAIARDKTGQVIASQKVSLSVDLMKEDQERVYSEIHETITNEFGLIVLEIGNGTERSGDLSQVEWNSNNYYIRLGMDAEGGRNFETMGTSQLLSVPYALYAEKAGDNGLRKDLWEEHQKHIYNTNRDNVGIGTMTPITKLEVIGVITATGGNSDQWNEAYSWGNHAGAGYLTSAWSLTGNSGTDPSLNFIGTSDDQPLKFRVNDQPAGEMNQFTLNTAFGFNSLLSITTGYGNTAFGNRALYSNTTGVDNNAHGCDALYYNTTGLGNTASGNSALHFNTTGSVNTAVGANSLYANTTGSLNNAFGAYALFSNTEGYSNTAFGISSLKENTTGYGNIGIGVDALFANTTGNSNTALGCGAGYSNSTGSGNVFLGSGAGYYETGSNKLYIANNDTDHPLIYGDFSSGKVGIGTNNPDASAILDLTTTNYGFLPPRLTLQQRNVIPNPTAGLIVWCSDCGASGELQVFNGTTWTNLIVGEANAQWICGNPFVDLRDSKSYETVLIGAYCWMAENLNVGTRINGNIDQSDNGIIEKYCYDDLESNCIIYGGLYQWNEAMQYSTQQGVQGICPPGWHIPTDAEWTAFTDYVKSVPDYHCDNDYNYIHFIAKSLAATTNWRSHFQTCYVGNDQAANNATGFAVLPGGARYTDGSFGSLRKTGYIWCHSTEYSSSNAWYWMLDYGFPKVIQYDVDKTFGFSQRCLKD